MNKRLWTALFLVFLGSLTLSGCAMVQLTDGGKRVRFIDGEVPASCTKVDTLMVKSNGGNGNAEKLVSARNLAANQAAELGATHLKVIGTDPGTPWLLEGPAAKREVAADAYRCP